MVQDEHEDVVLRAEPDTPEAAKSAEWYANLLVKYGPDGILSYSDDQSMRSQMSVHGVRPGYLGDTSSGVCSTRVPSVNSAV